MSHAQAEGGRSTPEARSNKSITLLARIRADSSGSFFLHFTIACSDKRSGTTTSAGTLPSRR